MSKNQEWMPCSKPDVGDTLRWEEPLWAEPNKPRGKPDKIGEQQITAKLIAKGNVLELEVLDIEKISKGEGHLKVKEGDVIRRKKTTLEQGDCCKLL